MQDLDYYNTLITVAEDCQASESTVPEPRAGKKTAAVIQYELLVDRPHELASADIIFESWFARQEFAEDLAPSERDKIRAQYFSRSQACLRASPLAKSFGWGLLFDDAGRVALLPRESSEYAHLAKGGDPAIQIVKAMRSSRA